MCVLSAFGKNKQTNKQLQWKGGAQGCSTAAVSGEELQKKPQGPRSGRALSLFLGDLKGKGKWVYSPDRLFLLKLSVEARGDAVESLDTFTSLEAPRGVSSPQPDATSWKPQGAEEQRKLKQHCDESF